MNTGNSNSITKPRIYIECLDNNGDRHNLTAQGWFRITGKSASLILLHRRQRKRGERKLTLRMVVGLDDLPFKKSGVNATKKLIEKQGELMAEFNSKRLVGV